MSKIKSSRRILAIACAMALLTSHACNANAKQANQSSINETDVNDVNKDASQAQTIILKEQAAINIKLFASTLQQALKTAIKEGGLNNGIEVCHSKAPEIASTLSVDGWVIKRTSLKTRNTANKPDQWEQNILNQFETQSSNGEDVTTLVVSSYDNEGFRLMKAIPTGPICMGCHGSSVDPKTLEKINDLYPNDQATGFSIGDLRGAFSVRKAIVE